MPTRRKQSEAAATAAAPLPPRTPTVEDLLFIPTRAQVEVEVKGLFFRDGAPVQFILQAVSFEQEREANRAAIKEGQKLGIGFCEDTWALEMALAGIAQPKIDRLQMQVLLNANAQIITQVVDALEELRTRPPRQIEAQLEQLAGVTVPAAPEPPPAG